MKKSKVKQAHTSSAKIGMGDYYGSGIRNPMAKTKSSFMVPRVKFDRKKPPKSLA